MSFNNRPNYIIGGVTKTQMPLSRGGSTSMTRLRSGSGTKWEVESILTSNEKQRFLRDLVLNTKKMTMKLNEDIIIANKTIDRKQVLAKMWNMKDIIQF